MTEEVCKLKKKLDNKVAIITGGASGIGEATTRLFASNGARAIVIADIQDELGRKVAESVGSSICSYYHCDVSDEEQVKKMVEWTVQTYGQLDIMFSNAGVYSSSSQTILELDFTGLERVFGVNVVGNAACVKHAARAMIDLNIRGSIICTSSMAGTTSHIEHTDYYVSKHALLGLMRCASKQLGGHGIRVNAVSPFAIATPLFVSVFKEAAKEVEKQFQALPSLKNVHLKVEHVADAVLFLASDDSAFITGQNLVIDGGVTA
ncbi:hypothetical protein Leryth_013070 [Lithospermum erythrorhizon]|uniref:Oxidoreductase n=1 Tax=Lithospermum erythrorhizon TaxID=34254 RepID=A0AAV3S1N2_LITER|nr:hypothetical protein Leryth_013070 [Lithospermum erythrorhizon]